MSNTRLTVVVRRDLQLSPGLLAAQVSHIGDQWLRERIIESLDIKADFEAENKEYKYPTIIELFNPMQLEWMKEPYISVLAVNTREELEKISMDATQANLKVRTWTDVIFSEVLKQPMTVLVGLSIGPDDFDKIKLVTGNLPLY
jgi:peptidyl-tRNA hydrolase